MKHSCRQSSLYYYIYIYTHLVISRSITTQGSSWIPSVPTKFVIVAKAAKIRPSWFKVICTLYIYHWWERPLFKSQGAFERNQQRRAHRFVFFFLWHVEVDLDTVEPDFDFGALAGTKVSRASDIEGSKDTLLSFDSSTHGSSGSARTSESAAAEFWLPMSTSSYVTPHQAEAQMLRIKVDMRTTTMMTWFQSLPNLIWRRSLELKCGTQHTLAYTLDRWMKVSIWCWQVMLLKLDIRTARRWVRNRYCLKQARITWLKPATAWQSWSQQAKKVVRYKQVRRWASS